MVMKYHNLKGRRSPPPKPCYGGKHAIRYSSSLRQLRYFWLLASRSHHPTSNAYTTAHYHQHTPWGRHRRFTTAHPKRGVHISDQRQQTPVLAAYHVKRKRRCHLSGSVALRKHQQPAETERGSITSLHVINGRSSLNSLGFKTSTLAYTLMRCLRRLNWEASRCSLRKSSSVNTHVRERGNSSFFSELDSAGRNACLTKHSTLARQKRGVCGFLCNTCG